MYCAYLQCVLLCVIWQHVDLQTISNELWDIIQVYLCNITGATTWVWTSVGHVLYESYASDFPAFRFIYLLVDVFCQLPSLFLYEGPGKTELSLCKQQVFCNYDFYSVRCSVKYFVVYAIVICIFVSFSINFFIKFRMNKYAYAHT